MSPRCQHPLAALRIGANGQQAIFVIQGAAVVGKAQ
jgi:hypothetical protein